MGCKMNLALKSELQSASLIEILAVTLMRPGGRRHSDADQNEKFSFWFQDCKMQS